MTRYIVLRATAGDSEEDLLVPRMLQAQDSALPPPDLSTPLPPSLPAPKVTVEDLGPEQAAEALQDPGILGLAEPMPTRLIAPTGSSSVEPPNGPTWGVAAVKAHDTAYNGQGVPVCILDTGIDATHGAFEGVNAQQRNFTTSADADANGHGTHCAGTLFGRNVGGTRIGVAPGVTDALIGKVLDDEGLGSSEMLFRAINWAVEAGARVLSMSLGFDFPGYSAKLVDECQYPVDVATSKALKAYRDNLRVFDAIMDMIEARSALGRGMVVVAATGNESRRSLQKHYRLSASVPSAAKGVLSVGALRRNRERLDVADFSNMDPLVCAPGVDIVSARAGGGLIAHDGTSMACPHAAGVAALWWQRLGSDPGELATAEAVVARLRSSCRTDVFASGVDLRDRGEGLVQAP